MTMDTLIRDIERLFDRGNEEVPLKAAALRFLDYSSLLQDKHALHTATCTSFAQLPTLHWKICLGLLPATRSGLSLWYNDSILSGDTPHIDNDAVSNLILKQWRIFFRTLLDNSKKKNKFLDTSSDDSASEVDTVPIKIDSSLNKLSDYQPSHYLKLWQLVHTALRDEFYHRQRESGLRNDILNKLENILMSDASDRIPAIEEENQWPKEYTDQVTSYDNHATDPKALNKDTKNIKSRKNAFFDSSSSSSNNSFANDKEEKILFQESLTNVITTNKRIRFGESDSSDDSDHEADQKGGKGAKAVLDDPLLGTTKGGTIGDSYYAKQFQQRKIIEDINKDCSRVYWDFDDDIRAENTDDNSNRCISLFFEREYVILVVKAVLSLYCCEQGRPNRADPSDDNISRSPYYLGYRQGMHELACFIVWALHRDADTVRRIVEGGAMGESEPEIISILKQLVSHRSLVFDAYWIFRRLMEVSWMHEDTCLSPVNGSNNVNQTLTQSLGLSSPAGAANSNPIRCVAPYLLTNGLGLTEWYRTSGRPAGQGLVVVSGSPTSKGLQVFNSLASFNIARPDISIASEGNTNTIGVSYAATMVQGPLLSTIHASLATHLGDGHGCIGLEPGLYGIRWLRLLYLRDFPFQSLLLLWSAVIAEYGYYLYEWERLVLSTLQNDQPQPRSAEQIDRLPPWPLYHINTSIIVHFSLSILSLLSPFLLQAQDVTAVFPILIKNNNNNLLNVYFNNLTEPQEESSAEDTNHSIFFKLLLTSLKRLYHNSSDRAIQYITFDRRDDSILSGMKLQAAAGLARSIGYRLSYSSPVTKVLAPPPLGGHEQDESERRMGAHGMTCQEPFAETMQKRRVWGRRLAGIVKTLEDLLRRRQAIHQRLRETTEEHTADEGGLTQANGTTNNNSDDINFDQYRPRRPSSRANPLHAEFSRLLREHDDEDEELKDIIDQLLKLKAEVMPSQ